MGYEVVCLGLERVGAVEEVKVLHWAELGAVDELGACG